MEKGNSQAPMEGWGQIPSQPSNFVSILHLRERWLNQNEHKHPDQKPAVAKPLLPKPRIHSTSSWSRKFVGYYRAVPASSRPCNNSADEAEKVKKSKKKPTSQSENAAEAVSSIHTEEKKKKKHLIKKKPRSKIGEALLPVSPIESDGKKKKSMKTHQMEKKPRSQGEDEGEALLAVSPIKRDQKKKKSKRKRRPPKKPEENSKQEMRETECEVGEHNGKKEVTTSPTPEVNFKKGMPAKERQQNENKYVIATKIDQNKRMESQCGSQTGNTDAMKEIQNKLCRISLSFENKRGRNNGVYKRSSHGDRNIQNPRDLPRLPSRKQRDAGMIWVRKDELPKGA